MTKAMIHVSHRLGKGRFVCLILTILFFLSSQSIAGISKAPSINLFPTTVVENIKETGETAGKMETELLPYAEKMQKQVDLFMESKCDDAETDPGCGNIKKQLAESWLDVLNTMEKNISQMETSMSRTNKSLEKSIRQELGRNSTPRGLQKLISGISSRDKRSHRTGRRSNLSSKFNQYYDLVRMGSRGGASNSLAVAATDIYLDTADALEFVALIKGEIERSKLIASLDQLLGLIGPEMFQTFAMVKTIMYGEEDTGEAVPASPISNDPEEWVSPLDE